ncbi:hypothetical protein SELMODRAFT_438767 [Selaginella moellendorffii]|uniref:Uncharacterized protein n=1 Tax=Selaginella moellendorffii TaxID=88036 RepID=D8QZ82_SELML|nr:hypothetical protein SELMODRAFT_438767 [Selaginella moellendorffii]
MSFTRIIQPVATMKIKRFFTMLKPAADFSSQGTIFCKPAGIISMLQRIQPVVFKRFFTMLKPAPDFSSQGTAIFSNPAGISPKSSMLSPFSKLGSASRAACAATYCSSTGDEDWEPVLPVPGSYSLRMSPYEQRALLSSRWVYGEKNHKLFVVDLPPETASGDWMVSVGDGTMTISHQVKPFSLEEKLPLDLDVSTMEKSFQPTNGQLLLNDRPHDAGLSTVCPAAARPRSNPLQSQRRPSMESSLTAQWRTKIQEAWGQAGFVAVARKARIATQDCHPVSTTLDDVQACKPPITILAAKSRPIKYLEKAEKITIASVYSSLINAPLETSIFRQDLSRDLSWLDHLL